MGLVKKNKRAEHAGLNRLCRNADGGYMQFSQALIQAQFEKRYKRFFADIRMGQKTEVAHVANTGSLKSCLVPGVDCLVKPSDNPERKLKYSLEALRAPAGSWVGINTALPGMMLKEAFAEKIFSHWKAYTTLEAEVKISAESRIDFVLSDQQIDRKKWQNSSGKLHFIEVKNVTLAVDDYENGKGVACFPDAVTERGQKHLQELMHLVEQGHSAEIFFCIQRTDCVSFRAAHEIDPVYADLLKQAHSKGVKVTAAVAEIDSAAARLTGLCLPNSF